MSKHGREDQKQKLQPSRKQEPLAQPSNALQDFVVEENRDQPESDRDENGYGQMRLPR